MSKPRSLTRLVQQLVYDYRPGRPGRHRIRRIEQAARNPVPSLYPPVEPRGGDQAATGTCAGCGKTLVDATRRSSHGGFKAHCWPCWVQAGKPSRPKPALQSGRPSRKGQRMLETPAPTEPAPEPPAPDPEPDTEDDGDEDE